jgi:hypothetical protein
MYGRLITGGVSDTKQPSLILTPNKRHVPLKEVESCLNRNLLVQFLTKICPLKKMTQESGAINGTITGILLMR